MQFHVTLNDRLPMPAAMGIAGMGYGYSNPSTVLVEADEVKVTDQGDLLFYSSLIESITVRDAYRTIHRQPIECFARGQWTRWKRID